MQPEGEPSSAPNAPELSAGEVGRVSSPPNPPTSAAVNGESISVAAAPAKAQAEAEEQRGAAEPQRTEAAAPAKAQAEAATEEQRGAAGPQLEVDTENQCEAAEPQGTEEAAAPAKPQPEEEAEDQRRPGDEEPNAALPANDAATGAAAGGLTGEAPEESYAIPSLGLSTADASASNGVAAEAAGDSSGGGKKSSMPSWISLHRTFRSMIPKSMRGTSKDASPRPGTGAHDLISARAESLDTHRETLHQDFMNGRDNDDDKRYAPRTPRQEHPQYDRQHPPPPKKDYPQTESRHKAEGYSWVDSDQSKEAEKHFRTAKSRLALLIKEDKENGVYNVVVGQEFAALGSTLLAMGRYEEAIDAFDSALYIIEAVMGIYNDEVAMVHAFLGQAHQRHADQLKSKGELWSVVSVQYYVALDNYRRVLTILEFTRKEGDVRDEQAFICMQAGFVDYAMGSRLSAARYFVLALETGVLKDEDTVTLTKMLELVAYKDIHDEGPGSQAAMSLLSHAKEALVACRCPTLTLDVCIGAVLAARGESTNAVGYLEPVSKKVDESNNLTACTALFNFAVLTAKRDELMCALVMLRRLEQALLDQGARKCSNALKLVAQASDLIARARRGEHDLVFDTLAYCFYIWTDVDLVAGHDGEEAVDHEEDKNDDEEEDEVDWAEAVEETIGMGATNSPVKLRRQSVSASSGATSTVAAAPASRGLTFGGRETYEPGFFEFINRAPGQSVSEFTGRGSLFATVFG